jgi:hypothetical protein
MACLSIRFFEKLQISEKLFFEIMFRWFKNPEKKIRKKLDKS